MKVHANAPLSPIGRRRVIDRVVIERWSVTAASVKTLQRWRQLPI